MQLRSVRLATRLWIGFGSILVLAVGILGFDIVASFNVRNQEHQTMEHASHKLELANAMRVAVYEAAISMRNIGLLQDAQGVQGELETIGVLWKAFNTSRNDFLESRVGDKERQIVARIDAVYAKAAELFKTILANIQKGDKSLASEQILRDFAPLGRQTIVEMELLIAEQQKAIDQARTQARENASWLALVLGLTTCVLVSLGIAFAIAITRSVAGPISDAVRVAEDVAQGKLGRAPSSSGSDEAAALLKALEKMDQTLAHIVDEVRESTHQIAHASNETAVDNAALSERTASQAAALQETAAAMRQLTDTVQQNAERARNANELAKSASGAAVDGGAVMGQVTSTMQKISQSSGRIVDITSVIDGIAFQTNILALNAAVEAARAGELGRGFAVVAAEVRTLAGRSSQASKEIKSLIEVSVGDIDNGTRFVTDAARRMTAIMASVQSVEQIMEEITTASLEQSAGIKEVCNAVSSMDEMTQRNSVLVERATDAAGRLQEHAARLASTVDRFDVSENEEGGAIIIPHMPALPLKPT